MCITAACLLLLEVNEAEWVDGNTIPQLMTHGAGADSIYLSHNFVRSFYHLEDMIHMYSVRTQKQMDSQLSLPCDIKLKIK